jgi:hypothetical protein
MDVTKLLMSEASPDADRDEMDAMKLLESIQNKDSMFRNGLFCRLFMVSPAYFE